VLYQKVRHQHIGKKKKTLPIHGMEARVASANTARLKEKELMGEFHKRQL
jgi:hypothetical protein